MRIVRRMAAGFLSPPLCPCTEMVKQLPQDGFSKHMPKPAPAAVLILTTTATRDDAQHLARQLVAEKLVACAQIDGPVESHYRWEGQLEISQEWRLLLKTTLAVADAAEHRLLRLHPYDEPEILRLPVSGGSASYLAWLAVETAPDDT